MVFNPKKSHELIKTFVLVVFGTLLVTPKGNATKCSRFLISMLKDQGWREAHTHAVLKNKFLDSTPAREKAMMKAKKEMEDEIRAGYTPSIDYYSAAGTHLELVFGGGEFGTRKPPIVMAQKLGRSGDLPLTLLLPVSGHNGFAKAKIWATSDTYQLQLENMATGKKVNISSKAKSLGLITFHELIVKLRAKEKYRLHYSRSGSLGSMGFAEGRILEIVWDGT